MFLTQLVNTKPEIDTTFVCNTQILNKWKSLLIKIEEIVHSHAVCADSAPPIAYTRAWKL